MPRPKRKSRRLNAVKHPDEPKRKRVFSMNQPASKLAPESAFNNVQQIVRKCKDPALSMEEGDILRESLQVLADRINLANTLEPRVKELEEKIAALEAEKKELESKAASAAIPPGFVLVPAAHAPATPAAAPAPATPPLSLVAPNGAQS